MVVPNIIGVNTVLYHKGSNVWETVTPSILNETGYTLASQNIGDYISIDNSRSFLIKANGVVINNTAKTLVLETTVTFQPYNNSVRAVFWSNPYVITQPLSYTTSATVNISLGTVEIIL